jgi:hypothetical protein
MRSRFLERVGALALCLTLFGCNSSTPVSPDSGPGGDDQMVPDASCSLSLAAVTGTTVNLPVGQKADLAVRLSNCRGDTPSGQTATFVIKGTANGSTLSASSAQTDAGGVAKIQITGGQTAATFQVEATVDGATPTVVFQINVTAKPLGNIDVTIAYAVPPGMYAKQFTAFQANLYSNQACANFDPFNLPAAQQQSAVVTSLADTMHLTNLVEDAFTVVLTGKSSADILAWGCSAGVSVTGGQTKSITVTLTDLPVVYSGAYDLNNQFDLTGAMPPSVASVISILSEIGDDHDLYNYNNANGTSQYGLDPAAFLLDFVYRQFCHWECKSGEDFDTCSQINHPQGDISALYMHDFASWNDKPLFWGLCGALQLPVGTINDEVFTWVNQQLQTQINNAVPKQVAALIQLISDVASVFKKMSIQSTLTLGGASHTSPGYTHELKTLTLTVHDLNGIQLTKVVKLSDAGLTNLSYTGTATNQDDVLQIPKHTFQLSFGKLLLYLWNNVVLSTLGYTSTANMFAAFLDCTAVGNWLYQQIGSTLPIFPASTYKGFCDLGLQVAGAFVDNAIQTSTSTTATMEIQGSCSAGTPLGAGRLALKLVNGTWTGTLKEGTWSKPITGTFTGQHQ